MVTLRRGILHRISQVMKSMKWLRMSMLSLVSGKGLARILKKMTCGRSNQIFLGATILERHRCPSFDLYDASQEECVREPTRNFA
jgi:hypothetical protein